MTTLTVDEILDASDLRNRAKHAAETARIVREEEQTQEQRDLYFEVRDWLVDVLKLTEEQVDAIDMEGDSYNDDRQEIDFELDGLNFRARYIMEKVLGKESVSFGKEEIMVPVLAVEVHQKHTWKRVESLAALGKLL